MSITVNDKNLGHATAYGYAKANGYTGTEAEYGELMADYGTVGQTAVDAKNDAVAAAGEASGSASSASDSAAAALRDAGLANGSAEAAAGSAEAASGSASSASTNALKSEGFAVGEQNGEAVGDSSPYYHNNAEYYADQAGSSASGASGSATSANADALKAEGFAVGEQNGAAVASGSPYYQNNAEYYAGQAAASAAASAAMTGLASAFSSSKAYKAGEWVIQGGKLYEFTADHAAGAWTGTDAVERPLSDEVVDLKNHFESEIETLQISYGFTASQKNAILACFRNVAWINDQGQTCYNALQDAFSMEVLSISAVYTQSGTVYDTNVLADLRPDLVVTATFSDGTQHTVEGYTLSGNLVAGTSTITVTYHEKTTTFNVTVTHMQGSLESITAVLDPNAVVTTEDTLEDLRQYLTVTANYDDSETQVVTGYTLSGTLEVGQSTITAMYNGKTDDFVVTVIEDYAETITATFVQGVYMFSPTDDLDDLKQFLVVTANNVSGISYPVTDYTLSGTLDNASSIVTVSYQNLTTTFTVNVKQLPSGYTKKTYLESDSSQYISTGITEVQAGEYSYKYKVRPILTNDVLSTRLLEHVFSSMNYYLTVFRYDGHVSSKDRYFATKRWGNDDVSHSLVWESGNDYVINAYINDDYVYINDEAVMQCTLGTTKDSTYTMDLFGYSEGRGRSDFKFRGRMYYFKTYSIGTNTKTHDYIPCLNPSSVAGMYDLVSDQFLPPASGTFSTD